MKRFIVLGVLLLALGTMRCDTAEATAEKTLEVSAPPLKKSLHSLKSQLIGNKGKLKELRKKILAAPEEQKAPLIKEKQEYKSKCQTLKAQIKQTRAKLADLQKSYFERAIKETTIVKERATNKVAKLEKKLAVIKKKLSEARETKTVAPPKMQKIIIKKIKVLTAKVKIVAQKLKEAKKVKTKAFAALKKFIENKYNWEIRVQEKKLVRKVKACEETRETIILLCLCVKEDSKTLAAMRKITPEEVKAAKALEAKIRKNEIRHVTLKRRERFCKKKVKQFAKLIKENKKILEKTKKAFECTELNKKLTKEIVKATKLHVSFKQKVKEAKKIAKKNIIGKPLSKAAIIHTTLKHHTTGKRALHPIEKAKARAIKLKMKRDIAKIKRDIKHAEKKKNRIKRKIRTVKGKTRKELIKAKEGIKTTMKIKAKIIKSKIAKLNKLKEKLAKVSERCVNSVGKTKEDLEALKRKLKMRIAKLEEELTDYKRKAILMKVASDRKCKKLVQDEKIKSKKLVLEAETKLKLAKSEASKLIKALDFVQKASVVTDKFHKLKIESLASQGKATNKDISAKMGELKAKAQEFKDLAELEKKKAASVRKMIEMRSAANLAKDSKIAKANIQKYGDKIKDSLEKTKSLKDAMLKATDLAVKQALKEQYDLEVKKLELYRREKLNAEKEIVAAEAEIILQKKAIENIKKEAKLKAILLEKQFKEKSAKMKVKFSKEKEKRIGGVLVKSKRLGEDSIKDINAQMKNIKAEFEEFKSALLKSHNSKTKELVERQTMDYKKKLRLLRVQLQKAKAKFDRFKVDYSQEKAKKFADLKKDEEIRLVELISNLKLKIKEAKVEYKSKIAASKQLVAQKLASKKSKTKAQLAALQKEKSRIEAQLTMKVKSLNKKIAVEGDLTRDLKSSIDAETTKQSKYASEYKEWKTSQDKSLKQTLKLKKAFVKKQISAIQAKIAKAKAKMQKTEAALTAKIKATNTEIATYEKQVKYEKSLFASLKNKAQKYKIRAKMELQSAVAGQKKKRKALAEDMAKKQAACGAKVLKWKKKSIELNAQLETLFQKIKDWNKSEEKIAAAKERIADYESKLAKLNLKRDSSQNTYNDVCGDDFTKDSAQCVQIQSDLVDMNVQIANAAKSIANERSTLFS